MGIGLRREYTIGGLDRVGGRPDPEVAAAVSAGLEV